MEFHFWKWLETLYYQLLLFDRKLRKTEQQLRGEVGDLRGQLDASRLENSRIATELATKDSQIQHLEVSEIRKHKTEINKVQTI